MNRAVLRLICAAALASITWAADPYATTSNSPEDFRIELNLWGWQFDPTGNLQSSGTTLDLVNDLGVRQQVDGWYGQLIFKPGRKHRIIIEGSPLRVSGSHSSTESFTYNGRTFSFNELLNTRASLDYFFGGYQYDFVSGNAGHLGISIGAAYLNATGTITAPQAGVTSSRSQQIGLPLAGIEGRVFPIPGHPFIDVNGGLRGMDFGSYGHYVEYNINGGLWLFHHLGIHGGYRQTAALLQNNRSSNGSRLDLTLKGPTVEISMKW